MKEFKQHILEKLKISNDYGYDSLFGEVVEMLYVCNRLIPIKQLHLTKGSGVKGPFKDVYYTFDSDFGDGMVFSVDAKNNVTINSFKELRSVFFNNDPIKAEELLNTIKELIQDYE